MGSSTARAVIDLDVTGPTISRHLYGHFAEHLGPLHLRRLLGRRGLADPERGRHPARRRRGAAGAGHPEPALAGRLLRRRVPLARRHRPATSDRPVMVNTHWGDVEENNHFGTHEFLALCELLGAEPYVNGNVGSGTVQEMSEWVEYLTRDGDSPMVRLRKANGRDEPWKVPFWGIGNETWGCGGQHARRELRRPGPPLRHVLPRPRRQQAVPDRRRRRRRRPRLDRGADEGRQLPRLHQRAPRNIFQAISFHYYTSPATGSTRASATEFDRSSTTGRWSRRPTSTA